MNFSPARFSRLLLLAALLPCAPALAQTISVTTTPVGYVQLTCTAASDTTLAVPFMRPAEFVGLTASVSGSNIVLSGSTTFTPNQFTYVQGTQPKTYYALLGPSLSSTNSKEGAIYQITTNGSNSLTVALNGDVIDSVPAGTQVTIAPYWTLGTVFPATSATSSFIVSTNPAIRETQILVPNYNGSGIDLSTAATYYFYQGNWRLFGDAITNVHDDDILIPNTYVTVRNPDTTTTLTSMGSVATGKLMVPLATGTSGGQDNFVSTLRPVDVALNDLGLISSGAFLASSSPAIRADQILVYDNTLPAFDKSATGTYFYFNNAWRLFGDSLANDHGSDVIPAGTGFVIRKAATSSGQTAFWQASSPY